MEMKKILAISLLQVVVFIMFGRTKVDAGIVEGCVGSQLSLICNKTKVISISSVVIGDSGSVTEWCTGASCCPKQTDRTWIPNDNHVNDVNTRCNGQHNCAVNVTRESYYSLLGISKNTDYERITYDCIDNGSLATSTLDTTLRTASAFPASQKEATYNSLTSGISTKPYSPDETKSTTTTKILTTEDATTPGLMPIIVAIICLVVFVLIIIVVIIMVKRKKTSSKIKSEVEMTDARNGQNGIYANQNQDTNRNPNNSSASRQNDGQNNCSSAIYAEPNNVVEYSVVSQETNPAAKGAGVEYCSVDIIKNDHKTPATKSEDDGYSLAGDPDNRQSTCVDNVYEDVESKQSDSKAKSGNIRDDGGAYEEPMKVGGQAVSSGQTNLNSKDKKSVSNSKPDEGVYKNIGEVGTLSSASSPYEPMTPSQSIYANESSVPFRSESLTSSLGSGSEAHTPYCEMRSPSVKLKDDGARMLVDNELYSA